MLYSSSIFLKLDNDGHSAADRFWNTDTQKQFAPVLWKDPIDNSCHGPNLVFIWGQGSVCIYSKSARWLQERLVKHIDSAQQRDDDKINGFRDKLCLWEILLFCR